MQCEAHVLCHAWPHRFVDTSAKSTSPFFSDPTYDFGVKQLLSGNVYIIIGTADHPEGELQGHAQLGWGGPVGLIRIPKQWARRTTEPDIAVVGQPKGHLG